MPRTAHRLVLSLTVACVFAAPASAAEVARTDGASLDARDSPQTGFCLHITETDSESGGGSGTCGRAPWRPRRSNLATWLTGERVIAGGAVPASVTRAEAELVDGRRISFETVAGPRYRGRHAGRLRFFLLALPVADRRDDEAGGLLLVRFFGADGTLAGAAEASRGGSRTGRAQLLLRERARGRSITVTSETQRRLAPTPLALDRTEELSCLSIGTRGRFGSSGSSTFCHGLGPNRPELLVIAEPGCGALRTVVAGFVGDAVTAIRLKLGSGRVREVRTRTYRDPRGGAHRYLATIVPRGEAVRSVAAVGADAGYELREPPSGLPCMDDDGAFGIPFFLADEQGTTRPSVGDEQVTAEADGHRLLVRDAEGERLCAGLDRLRSDGGDCLLPAVNGEDAFGSAASGMVFAVLPGEVARVRLPDGREVDTVEGGYTGRYARAVRFLFVKAKPLDGRFRMLDSAGAVIATLGVFSPDLLSEGPVSRRVPLASGRNWRLAAAKHQYGACVYLTLGRSEPECASSLERYDAVDATVGCTPRLAVLTGSLDRGTRSVRAVLRGGRTLRARVLTVPRRISRARAWVLALPRGARVTALRFDGRRIAFPLLPAARQCGYRVYGPSLGTAVPELELSR